jgi:transformation/transcription domain-associated protein
MYANTKTVVEKEFGEKSGLKPPVSRTPTTSDDCLTKKVSAGLAPSPNPPTPASDSSAPPPPPAAAQQPPSPPYARALHSPKVLTECPIAVVLIFQTWKNIMPAAMLDFYPLVMESIRIQPEPQRKAHEDAKEKGEVFVGVAAGIHNREMYTELIKAQVKVSHEV